MKQVTIYTNGACRKNPGPGGWAAVLLYGDTRREISGGSPATTNNRMELQAAIEALRALKEPCIVTLYTDSAYLKNGVSKWIEQWKTRNWLTRGAFPVQNEDLWRDLDNIRAKHTITWHLVRGHSRDTNTAKCDQLAKVEIGNINRTFPADALEKHLKAFFYHRKQRKQLG